jgi:hypothetical protein
MADDRLFSDETMNALMESSGDSRRSAWNGSERRFAQALALGQILEKLEQTHRDMQDLKEQIKAQGTMLERHEALLNRGAGVFAVISVIGAGVLSILWGYVRKWLAL